MVNDASTLVEWDKLRYDGSVKATAQFVKDFWRLLPTKAPHLYLLCTHGYVIDKKSHKLIVEDTATANIVVRPSFTHGTKSHPYITAAAAVGEGPLDDAASAAPSPASPSGGAPAAADTGGAASPPSVLRTSEGTEITISKPAIGAFDLELLNLMLSCFTNDLQRENRRSALSSGRALAAAAVAARHSDTRTAPIGGVLRSIKPLQRAKYALQTLRKRLVPLSELRSQPSF